MIEVKDIKQSCRIALVFFSYWFMTALVFSVLIKVYSHVALEAHIIDLPSEKSEINKVDFDKFDISKTSETIKTVSLITKYCSIAIASYIVFFLKSPASNKVAVLAVAMITILMGTLFFAIGMPVIESLYQVVAFILLSSFFLVASKNGSQTKRDS